MHCFKTMAQPSSDRLTSTNSAEALNLLILDTEEKTVNPKVLNAQVPVTIGPRRDIIDQSGSLSAVGHHKTGYVSDAYFSQTPLVYNGGGYESAACKQGTYQPYVNAEGLENGSHGIHNESPSAAFHGYGYTPHLQQGPSTPVAAQLPSLKRNGHLYDVQQFLGPDPSCFQQPVSPKESYIVSSSSVSQVKLPVHVDLQGESKRVGLRTNYHPLTGSSSRGDDLFGKHGGLGFLHQRFERSEVGGLWSDWSKSLNGNSSLLQLSSPAASLTSIRSLEFSQDDIGRASRQKGSFFGFGSCSGSSYGCYSHGMSDQGLDYGSVSTSRMGPDGQNWPTLNEARHGGRCNFSCSCTVTLDTLSERNRGPRAFKPKIRAAANGFAVDNSNNVTIDVLRESCNQSDFVTDYKIAKFFIIKSYSEDNVHKSIKYGVWASTPNGNKKLDAAYCEAKEKHGVCPIFLLFSVNASAQFCGVAEMIGPVDFGKSVDYWLQDKWSGQFPVKWHIIKDVPNSQFRHILLENNDNKPVTNSRDTQEVGMEQGIEMLNIFKNYKIYSSILDDFSFYEQREKAMQERKAGQQASRVAPPLVVTEGQTPVSLSNDFVKKMSKSFAEALLLTEHEKEHSAVGKVVSGTTAAVAHCT